MDESNAAAVPQTLETPPPVINTEPRTVIHGLERLTAPAGVAIGVADIPGDGGATPSDQVVEQPAGQAPETTVPVHERINQDPELKSYIDKVVQSSTSRAINDARSKWDGDVLQKKLQADRAQREEALKELALKAQAGGDEGALALQELGKTVQAQVLRQQSAAEFAQVWFQEADMAVAKQVGGNLLAHEQLRVGNYGTVADWVDAVVKTKTSEALAQQQDGFQKELDKLAEAKAADIVAARRQNLPVPDNTPPVQTAPGSIRKWTTLAEAAALFSRDEIDAREYAIARQWYEEGRIKPGVYTGE